MCDEDYDGQVTLTDEWRRARKAHECCACHEAIRPGDRYHYVAQKYDGDLQGFAHCARCYAICKALWAAGATMIEWDLHCGDEWEENFGPLPDEVAALAFLTPDEAQARAR